MIIKQHAKTSGDNAEQRWCEQNYLNYVRTKIIENLAKNLQNKHRKSYIGFIYEHLYFTKHGSIIYMKKRKRLN